MQKKLENQIDELCKIRYNTHISKKLNKNRIDIS